MCVQRRRRPARGGLLPADFNGPHSSDIPKRYTGARDTTFARSARNNWIPKRDGYIHTYIHAHILEIRMRSRVPRAANVYIGAAHTSWSRRPDPPRVRVWPTRLHTSRATFVESLQQVCTGRELG